MELVRPPAGLTSALSGISGFDRGSGHIMHRVGLRCIEGHDVG